MLKVTVMRWLVSFVSLLTIFTPSRSDHPNGSRYWDFCAHPSKSGVVSVMSKFSLPRAGSAAGKFRIVESTDGLRRMKTAIDCAEACCNDKGSGDEDDEALCDVALFRKLKGQPRCFLLTCRQDKPEACDPVSHEGDNRFNDAVMIRLRKQPPKKVLPTFKERLCSPDSPQASCPKGELCQPNSKDGAYVCQCKQGEHRIVVAKTHFGRCVGRPLSTTVAPFEPKQCEYGLEECPKNEECVTELSHKKNGICQCTKGATRNATGQCIAPTVPPNVTASAPPTGTPRLNSNNSSNSSTPSPSSPSSHSFTLPSKKVTSAPLPLPTSKAPTPKPKPPGPQNGTVESIPLQKLDIILKRNHSIQLPVNELTLEAKVKDPPKDSLTYVWSLLSRPEGAEGGMMEGRTTPKLHLSKLMPGEYRFKLVVQGRRHYGEATIRVSVQPAKRINQPPIARVKSASEVLQLPNNLVLDGTPSSDDDKIVSFKWEEVSGPLNQNDLKSTNTGILELKGLIPGDYVFKLTVTDSDGATNSTNVNVTVIKAKDYPPTANAGQNVVINLPTNSVTLYGNASTDDHGIKTYEWVKVGNDKLTADMTGVREPALRLKNLEQGDYVFELKVTDTAGQVSTAQVKVYVHAKRNTPPTPKAGGDRTVTLPLRIITLDGSQSKDDEKITRYEWTQISGPHSLTLKDANQPKVQVSNLKEGVYKFRLTVWDKEELHNFDTMQLTVQESENQRPKAQAGGDQLVQLPTNLVRLDGRRSWDDKQIVSFFWTRADDSLAAGRVLNDSDRQAQLLLTDLEPGKYVFKLTVRDAEGLQASDTANIMVKPDSNLKNVLEMRFQGDLKSFKESNKADIVNQLKLLLTKSFPDGDIRIHIEEVRQLHHSNKLLLRFFVSKKSRTVEQVLDGKAVLKVLRQRVRSGVALLDLDIDRLDTAVCQTSCSGHGKCHQLTGRCVCEAFWMENHLRVRYGDGEHNCDWSILYVIILSCLGVLFLAASAWFFVYCRRRYTEWRDKRQCEEANDVESRRRWRRPRAKRGHKYSLLGEFDEKDGGLKLSGFPQRNGKGKHRRTGSSDGGTGTAPGLLASDSDLSSDEEDTLFVNKRPVSAESKAVHRANGTAGAL